MHFIKFGVNLHDIKIDLKKDISWRKLVCSIKNRFKYHQSIYFLLSKKDWTLKSNLSSKLIKHSIFVKMKDIYNFFFNRT
jgi:hypothetical protein